MSAQNHWQMYLALAAIFIPFILGFLLAGREAQEPELSEALESPEPLHQPPATPTSPTNPITPTEF